MSSFIFSFAALLFSPFLLSIINRTKAVLGGRKGAPLLQPYYDIIKLIQKGAVYSCTTTWVFKAGPAVGLAATIICVFIVPFGAHPAPFAFSGDFVLLAYLLGLSRFFTVSAALDTGSSFEGMGASREAAFSALAEPALFLALAAVARKTGELSLSGIFHAISAQGWGASSLPIALLTTTALLIIFLAENARIPVDDPNTHLELTMIHEVMVLDHGGMDLAFIQYGASLKLWVLGAILMGCLAPGRPDTSWLGGAAFMGGMCALSVLTGVIESSMARLRLVRVPQLLSGAGGLAALALILVMR
ncbi:MAG: NADH-quinone oxidoreductase subunit H [Desulfobacteraceae bacterium]|nr:NADH-quinone oxidoreductase subunit H [Desulfobacteraceae bacterium]